MGLTPVSDKDLPDIKPEDIKLDTSEVDKLDEKALSTVKSRWVSSQRSNEQLLFLLEMCPAKVKRIEEMLATQKEPDKSLVDKVARLKEEYAVVIKEIATRKGVK